MSSAQRSCGAPGACTYVTSSVSRSLPCLRCRNSPSATLSGSRGCLRGGVPNQHLLGGSGAASEVPNSTFCL